jgi:hypothetical protein
MGLDRRLRRQQQKHPNGNALAQLQSVLGDLQKVGQIGKTVQEAEGALKTQLPGLIEELSKLRDGVKMVLAENADLKLGLERQRAVFLRFLYRPDLLLPSGRSGLEKFLATEQRYRDEYDAAPHPVDLMAWIKEGHASWPEE